MELKYSADSEIEVRKIIKEHFAFSEKLYLKIKNDYIFVNGKPAKVYDKLYCGDILTVDLGYAETCDNIVANNKIPLDILYEDDWMLIVNKQAGIPVHSSLNYYDNSLSNGVKYYFETIHLNKKIRPVNRLDKDTSGIVIFAKCEYIQESLSREMQKDIFKKEYIAIVDGKLEGSGIINKPIGRKDSSIIERCISKDGDTAITKYSTLKNIKLSDGNYISVVQCTLETGRTHQIRVHMASICHSLIGDTLYGVSSNLINRQALHAYKIHFIHPITREEINLTCDIPKDMENIINYKKSK